MSLEVVITISSPLNFLGFARDHVSRKDFPFLWSRTVEGIFAQDRPLDKVFSEIPEYMRVIIQEYEDPFCQSWNSFFRTLTDFEKELETLWNSTSEKVTILMEQVHVYYGGIIEVFPVMPFFRKWPRSNPLTMPAVQRPNKELLELLVHEILHRTTEDNHPHSLWRSLSMIFLMKKVAEPERFLMQHALIYVAASWIASTTLEKEFQLPHLKPDDSYMKEYKKMEKYMHSLSELFPPPDQTSIEFAEEIVESCTQ